MRYQDGEIVFDSHLEGLLRGVQQWGVVEGLSVSPHGGMLLDVSPGIAKLNEEVFTFDTVTELSLPPADASYPRKDVVILDGTGTIRPLIGTPAQPEPYGKTGVFTYSPKPPDFPDVAIPLAEVWVGAAVTEITSADITDRRHFIKHYITAEDLAHSIDASGIGFNADKLDGKDAVDFMSVIPGEHGDMIYHDAEKWTRLPRPAEERWLKHPGGAVAPTWESLPPTGITAIKTYGRTGAEHDVTETEETLKDEATAQDTYTNLMPMCIVYEGSNPSGSGTYLSLRAELVQDEIALSTIHETVIGEGSAESFDLPVTFFAREFWTLYGIKSVRLYARVGATPPAGYEPKAKLSKVYGWQY